jgi:predicted nuclease of predicted toxin-antitoxin system
VRFFLDHDVPAAVKDALARHGHEVTQVTDVLPADSADELIFTTAQQDRGVMITCNRNDFLALAKKVPHHGLIILIRRRSAELECTNLLRLIRQAGQEGLASNINFA